MNEQSAYEITEKQPDEQGGDQVGPTERQHDPRREGVIETESIGAGDECGGVPGGFSPWGSHVATLGSLSGGILHQLIASERERLDEAQQCIEWYKNQVEKHQKRLAELAALERLEREQREQSNGH